MSFQDETNSLVFWTSGVVGRALQIAADMRLARASPEVQNPARLSLILKAHWNKAVEMNKGSNLPCSFAAHLRCSLVADRCGYAPRSRLAGRQNPGGNLLPLFISTA
jgi:hypothetical protein